MAVDLEFLQNHLARDIVKFFHFSLDFGHMMDLDLKWPKMVSDWTLDKLRHHLILSHQLELRLVPRFQVVCEICGTTTILYCPSFFLATLQAENTVGKAPIDVILSHAELEILPG